MADLFDHIDRRNHAVRPDNLTEETNHVEPLQSRQKVPKRQEDGVQLQYIDMVGRSSSR